MNRIATGWILLSILTVLIVSTFGLLTMDPLFRLLGAGDARRRCASFLRSYEPFSPVWRLPSAVLVRSTLFVIALFVAGPIASIFTDDPEVVRYTQWYLWIVMPAMIGLNLHNWTSQELNAAEKPKWVLLINVAGTAVILIPFTVLGSRVYGYRGMLVGLCVGQLLLGFLATQIGRRELSAGPDVAGRSLAPASR